MTSPVVNLGKVESRMDDNQQHTHEPYTLRDMSME
jgi:hypothetical protein